VTKPPIPPEGTAKDLDGHQTTRLRRSGSGFFSNASHSLPGPQRQPRGKLPLTSGRRQDAAAALRQICSGGCKASAANIAVNIWLLLRHNRGIFSRSAGTFPIKPFRCSASTLMFPPDFMSRADNGLACFVAAGPPIRLAGPKRNCNCIPCPMAIAEYLWPTARIHRARCFG
jgi:hypothetical protein